MPIAPLLAAIALAGPQPAPAAVPALHAGAPAERARPVHPLAALIHRLDYPAAALRDRAEGRVVFALGIGPNGRVHDCRIAESSGSAALDSATCRILRSRARYRPARDAAGHPVADIDAGALDWTLPRG